MRTSILIGIALLFRFAGWAQVPAAYNSAAIYQQLQKLNVLGSVLYVAAHPDDENTRLLAYLAKEKQFRTGYLSLTRGDGGQNLIGDEQGIELGLIRTQELLAARRVDGAEQFFSRAYDFGFSKSTEEALRIWDKDKVLADVVWVIRKFQPDIIITRFPGDSRAGHGHHSASAVLANEAFIAAADPTKYTEQFAFGVKPWQAKRILWNTFNFGGNNTTANDQYKLDVGNYNPLLGKSFGELASESRSQHKSQGFGVPRQRGQAIEYFTTTGGDAPKNNLMDGVTTTWQRVEQPAIEQTTTAIIKAYDLQRPQQSIPALVNLYQQIQALPEGYWRTQKLKEVQDVIIACSGLFADATTNQEFVTSGDTLKISAQLNNRNGVAISLDKIQLFNAEGFLARTFPYPTDKNLPNLLYYNVDQTKPLFDSSINRKLNANENVNLAIAVNKLHHSMSQPYWLTNAMQPGYFDVKDQRYIGMAENLAVANAVFHLTIEGLSLQVSRPAQYKFTDPVKGELYQPITVLQKVNIALSPTLALSNVTPPTNPKINFIYTPNTSGTKNLTLKVFQNTSSTIVDNKPFNLQKGISQSVSIPVKEVYGDVETKYIKPMLILHESNDEVFNQTHKSIKYDHIPNINYFYQDVVKVVDVPLKTVGKKIGYIIGAGDKVPTALSQMGYEVTALDEATISTINLKQFDAIVTGVRAYNVHEYLSSKYEVLMDYVKAGGNLIVQYNTNNQIGPVKAKISPYPFNITRTRVTDEKAEVTFLLPQHPVLNYPNKISATDFEGWVQERSIYHADNLDANFVAPLAMGDAGEAQHNGSLVIAPYGKGNFVYTGLVFFRQLPAGTGGAYRLMANLIALPKNK
jgi:LmbE family N-acetylglucosaminyl deacetylase